MKLITLDFETAYGGDLGFKKQTTEEYINDPRFEVIGVGVKVEDGESQWYSGSHEDVGRYLKQFDIKNNILLCHNTMFDGAILSWRFGIEAAMYLDTLCMARALHGVDAGGSLKALAERYELGVKGTEVNDAINKFRKDFSAEDLARYGEYCRNDVDLTFDLFRELASNFDPSELELIDMTLRMFITPKLEVDDALLQYRLEEVQQNKKELLASVMNRLGCDDEEAVRKKLASNKQFAELLKELGVEPPVKISKTTGKETYALAKNDQGFLDLQEHEDSFIQQLCAVRLGTKSTIEESRLERFIDVGARNKGKLPIPLKYYGAHTGRWAGSDAVNFQNLPSRDKRKKALKRSIVAPDGYYIINCDSSQIEARVLAWLAGEEELVKSFADGEDVYCKFASLVYDREITKADPIERFVGKTCLSDSTRVLTRSGWKLILELSTTDELWDGVEWVKHQGVSFMGVKPTINLHGLELTADHEILTAHTKWETAQYVQTHDSVFQSAVDLATSSLSDMKNTLPNEIKNLGVGDPCVSVVDATTFPPIMPTTYGVVDLQPAINVLNARPQIKDGGDISPSWRMTSIEQDYLIDSLQQSQDVILRRANNTFITGSGVLLYLIFGEKIEQSFSSMFRPLKDGITQILRWTESTWIKVTNQTILGSYREAKTYAIKEESQTSKPVYDILNSGSRRRFTVLTDRGPLIVHNCTLGLGYGTGAKKLQHTLKTTPPGVEVDDEEAKRLVDLYRETNKNIIKLWNKGDLVLKHLANWERKDTSFYYGKHRCLKVDKQGIKLPNGLYIRYPELEYVSYEGGDSGYEYKSRKGKVFIWGGALVENVVQALARIIVGQQMVQINKKYPVVLTVHDAAVCVVKKEEIDEALSYITGIMSTPPDWAVDLPVACEAAYADNYGDC